MSEVEYTKESKILAIAPKVPAFLSMLGSSYIVYNVLWVQRKKGDGRNTMYQQLMGALSVVDIFASQAYFLGTFLIPRGSGGPFGPVYWAFGTDRTCSYAGFFNQFAVASPIYNTMLSVYFLLKIRYGWRESQLSKMGWLLHGFPLMFALGTAFFALFRQPDTLYGNVFWTCWINPDPPQPDFRWFQWSFLFAPVWACVFFQTIAMTFLYMSVKNVEEQTKEIEQNEPGLTRMRKSTEQDDSWSEEDVMEEDEDDMLDDENDNLATNNKNKGLDEEQPADAAAILAARQKKQHHSRVIAIQGILYVAAFYITWMFPTIQRIMEVAGIPGKFVLQALDTSLLPLQGLFNVIIYLRPKYVFYRRKYPDLPARSILKMVHNRTNETPVVQKYTTRLNEQLSRIQSLRTEQPSQINALSQTRSTAMPKKSALVSHQDALPAIMEGSSTGRGATSSASGHNDHSKVSHSSNNQDSTTGRDEEDQPNNNGGLAGAAKVASVRMDGAVWTPAY